MTQSKSGRRSRPSAHSANKVSSGESSATSLYRFRDLPPRRWGLLALFLAVTIGSLVVWGFTARRSNLDEYSYEKIASYPHDIGSFTQGLVYLDGHLYESTGQIGRSKVRKIELKTGRVVIDHDLDPTFFGEGLARVDDTLVQLTWQNRVGIVYDLDLSEVKRFRLEDDAWGLTFDGQHLIMSDGTSTLSFLNPETFKVERQVMVRREGSRMGDINELEYINGLVYANVWKEESIYQINPEDGKVVGRIDLHGLLPWDERPSPTDSVLNGIAIHTESGNLLVTGKNWPKVFEIRLVRR